MKLENVILPSRGSDKTFDITTANNIVTSVTPSPTPHKCPSLLLPALCHPHIHLDKAYILTSNNPTYSHLAPRTGSFSEALATTARAKSLYTEEDLYLRGAQLLSTIYSQGATSARAFVEIDAITGTLPLAVARRLKREFAHLIHVQIVAFAQEPLFSGTETGWEDVQKPSGEPLFSGPTDGKANLRVLEEVLASEVVADIDVLGTTPYVEFHPTLGPDGDYDVYPRNIHWAVKKAIELKLHLDFHLDYTLKSGGRGPMVMEVLACLDAERWTSRNPGKTVAIGHCTQISVAAHSSVLREMVEFIKDKKLPVHFVGLPTSDLFMMGRDGCEHGTPRGTLPVLELIKRHGVDACLGVNNVGNAFTPYGTGDPLGLASWGVGIYHAGTAADAEELYGCVSWRARRAIGLATEQDGKAGRETDVVEGGEGEPMLLVENREAVELPGRNSGEGAEGVMKIPARQRLSVRDVVWDPPEVNLRRVVRSD